MCLQIDTNYKRPKNDSIRYKVLRVDNSGNLVSPHYRSGIWKIGRIRKIGKVDENTGINEKGYHVHSNLSAAITWRYQEECIVKCRCRGFIAGGNEQEIWKEVKLISIVRLPMNKKIKINR